MANTQVRQLALRQSSVLWLVGVCALTGCHSLKLLPGGSDRPEKTDKEIFAAAVGKRSFRVSQFVFVPDFDIQEDLPLFRELGEMREQVHKELQLPNSTALIQVHIFEDRQRYEQFMHVKYPFLPNRRAFFVAQPHAVGVGGEDLLVYTYWGDRIREDLRHELTHALLHSVLKDVPLWLDEGLAEYFEVGPEWQGIHSRHLEQIRAVGGSIGSDLGKLEAINQVQQMSATEYREAWTWVHMMLRDKPEAKAVLIDYLQQLRINPSPGSLQPRLAQVYTNLDDALQRHMASLDPAWRYPPSAQRYDD
jgi:hypothetical protein